MTMHLEGPWLSTTGKKKGKQKFRNAEQAQKARAQAEAWNDLVKKYEPKKRIEAMKPSKPTPYRRETPHIPSLNSDNSCGVATKGPEKVYTGTNIVGIATMHKSNAVPVFSAEDAVDIAKMRR